MRIRATVAAVSGALALAAVAAPAAQADDTASSYAAHAEQVMQIARTQGVSTSTGSSTSSGMARSFAATTATVDEPYAMDVSFSNFKIASAVKVGTTNHVATTVTYTMTHGTDVDITADDFYTGPYIYRGSYDAPDNLLLGYDPATCKAKTTTTATCTGKIDVYPAEGDLWNSDAGTWKGGAIAISYGGQDLTADELDLSLIGYADQGSLGTTKVQRYSRLTVNASPEPVKKGKTITVTGKLSRANWEDNKYHGYTGQSVKLQFRKKNSSTYTTVKTIKTNSTGNLKTTVKASVDGYYRYAFAGTTTTPAVKAAGDFVDVK